jgi:2-polyprenyl-3-methyl-5-hydroxy-6-metoxy-1,4-benzoquinol methylase
MLIEEIPAKRSEPYKRKRTGWMRFKYAIRSRVVKYRTGEAIISKIWRPLKFVLWKIRWGLGSILQSRQAELTAPIDVDKVYRVSPQRIVFSALQEFNLHDFNGQILGGEWDQLEKRFDSLDLYLAIRQVCQDGKQWADTVFYQRNLAELQSGHADYGCQTERDLIEKCRRIEALYHDIRRDGYKPQTELLREGKVLDRMAAQEEVAVSIGRYGDLLFSDGAHRLAIAKLLAIPEIPVKIAVRHAEWARFRNELLFYGREDAITRGHGLYQPATHPDFADLPAVHACEPRFKLIAGNLSVNKGCLLDIGANLGYFCHRFEELGFECYAVENHPQTAYFLKRLARAENRSFKVITESIFDAQEARNAYFDVILALNIFHHFLKTRADYAKLADLLSVLHMGELIFETPAQSESPMDHAYKHFSPEEFVDFIMVHTGLKYAEFIGYDKETGVIHAGRPIYKIY